MNYKHKARHLTRAALIAALYVVLTLLSNTLGLGYGPIQFRLSEAVCVLCAFFPEAVSGLTVGCVIANLFSPLGVGMIGDMIFGSFATFLGAWGARKLRKHPLLLPIPTVAANTMIVPLVLAFFYSAEDSIPFMMLTVGLGEIASAYLLGLLLLSALRSIYKNPDGRPGENTD